MCFNNFITQFWLVHMNPTIINLVFHRNWWCNKGNYNFKDFFLPEGIWHLSTGNLLNHISHFYMNPLISANITVMLCLTPFIQPSGHIFLTPNPWSLFCSPHLLLLLLVFLPPQNLRSLNPLSLLLSYWLSASLFTNQK